MTREQLHTRLLELNYTYERENEFNRDVYSSTGDIESSIGKFAEKLEIYATYYSCRIVWNVGLKTKVSKSYYFSKLGKVESVEALLGSFFTACEEDYLINIEEYRV